MDNRGLNKRRPSKDVLLYIAGFFDGEGSISILRTYHGKYDVLRVNLTNTHRPVLLWIQGAVGGLLGEKIDRYRVKRCWVLSFVSKQAEDFLKMLLPWLIIKKESALAALKYRKTFTRQWGMPGMPSGLRRRRASLVQKFYRLKEAS